VTGVDAAADRAHAEALLDDALRETFPASDPVSVFVPQSPAVAGLT
jgi:hypothetical protein